MADPDGGPDPPSPPPPPPQSVARPDPTTPDPDPDRAAENQLAEEFARLCVGGASEPSVVEDGGGAEKGSGADADADADADARGAEDGDGKSGGESGGDGEKEENGDSQSDDEKREERRRVNKYPVRPEAEDCSYYIKTGTCKFGSNCKFNHPVRRKNLVWRLVICSIFCGIFCRIKLATLTE